MLARTMVTLEGTLLLLAPEMSFVHAAMTTMQSKEAVVVDQRAMIRDELRGSSCRTCGTCPSGSTAC